MFKGVKDRMITHSIHCPSVELNMIWNEKVFMVEKASNINPFSSEYFCWIDAGICVYRNNVPPINMVNPKKIDNLPKDKFIFSSSSNTFFDNKVTKTNYYHFISGTYIIHKNIIGKFSEIYKEYLYRLVDKNNIWTDQVILTHI